MNSISNYFKIKHKQLMRIYIILAVWPVTKNNHAGMYYLAKEIQQQLDIPVKIYKLPVWKLGYLYPIYRIYAFMLGLFLRIKVKKNDIVWLMEYLLKTTEQSGIAKILKDKTNLLGLAHLVPEIIEKQYSDKRIKSNINKLDKLYVLGSSLKQFFISKGINQNKITVTYHYVDTDYYKPDKKLKSNNITVICMGNMQRDYSQLQSIVEKCNDINFIICSGHHNINSYFGHYNNVKLIGYINENELKHLMQTAHISLNVMKDTIGSNVIVSSLACGLPVVASNVGSISDYVENGKNGFLFNNADEAACIIHKIASNNSLLSSLSNEARLKAESISLNRFISFFKDDNLN